VSSNMLKIAKMFAEIIRQQSLGSDLNDIQISKDFSLKEFQCSCCNAVKINPELVRRLQKLRDEIGKPIVIISGYRCEKHNEAVGGAKQSQHLFGNAADIRVKGMSMEELADVAEKYFQDGGLGRYRDGHVHCDIRGEKVRWNL